MKFSIRDLLLATVIVALAFGWWVDHRQLADELRKTKLRQLGRLARHAEITLPNSSAPVANPPKP